MSDETTTAESPIYDQLSDDEAERLFAESAKEDKPPAKKWTVPKFTKTETGPTPTVAQAKKLCADLPHVYYMLGMAIYPVDNTCGKAIVENAEDLGASWLPLAESSPAFRRFLAKLKSANSWGTVFMAHAPLLITVASHHGMGEVFGRKPVETSDESENDYNANVGS